MMERERRPDRRQTYGITHEEPEQATWDHDEQYASHGPRMIYTGQIPAVEEEWVDADKRPPTASELAYGDARGNKPGRQAVGPTGQQATPSEQRHEDSKRKADLLDQALEFAEFPFDIISKAADAAITDLSVPEVPKTDFTKQLIGFAAASLLGASSGAVVTWLLGSMTSVGVTAKAAATVQGLIGGAITKALQSDRAQAAATLDDIKRAFRDVFNVQQLAAKRDFIGQRGQLRAGLAVLSVDELVQLNAASKEQNVQSIYTEMKLQTFIAWTNFLARVKHGAMGAWDHWEENGGRGAIALPGAAQKPSAGALDPARNNVALNGNSPLLETIQRPMQEDPFGILEVFVDATGGYIINQPGYRMRLDNVGPEVRKEFKTSGKKLRDLPVNKIIHMCSNYHGGVRVDPPTSIASVLITADGYVRASNWAELQKMHFKPKQGPVWDPAGFGECMDGIIQGKETSDCHIDRKAMASDIAAFASAAQELPVSWLET